MADNSGTALAEEAAVKRAGGVIALRRPDAEEASDRAAGDDGVTGGWIVVGDTDLHAVGCSIVRGAELGPTFWWQQDGLVDTGVVGVAGALETEVGVQCKGECGGLQGVVGWNSSAGATEGRTFATTGGGKAIDGSGAV